MQMFGENLKTITTASSLPKGHENLDRDKMFNDAWWLQYCCCRGVAIGDIGNPYFGEEGRNLCLHSTCELTQIGDPFCQTNLVECCITSQCQFPKAEGSPTCVCFNKPLAGADGVSGWKQQIFGWEGKFDQQFWLYYFLCAGCSVHGLRANGRPLYALVQKQFCIKRGIQLVQPTGSDGNLCSGVGTSLCFWTHCQFPPAKDTDTATPFIACCNKRMKNKDKGGNAKPLAYGKPGQEEMA
jgi:hypothetical protein